jgi:hypothetical protein
MRKGSSDHELHSVYRLQECRALSQINPGAHDGPHVHEVELRDAANYAVAVIAQA